MKHLSRVLALITLHIQECLFTRDRIALGQTEAALRHEVSLTCGKHGREAKNCQNS